MNEVLIAGDSFGANWPIAGDNLGWPDILALDFKVTNISQAGVGEYKILKQIESINQKDFDIIIINHTSPGRVHTRKHPIHSVGLHKDCDLLYNDIDRKFSMFNRALQSAKDWFLYHYDDNYQKDIYRMIRKQIDNTIILPYLALSHMPVSAEFSIEKNHLDLSKLWSTHRGDVNHYSKEGNYLVALTIKNKICEIMK